MSLCILLVQKASFKYNVKYYKLSFLWTKYKQISSTLEKISILSQHYFCFRQMVFLGSVWALVWNRLRVHSPPKFIRGLSNEIIYSPRTTWSLFFDVFFCYSYSIVTLKSADSVTNLIETLKDKVFFGEVLMTKPLIKNDQEVSRLSTSEMGHDGKLPGQWRSS